MVKFLNDTVVDPVGTEVTHTHSQRSFLQSLHEVICTDIVIATNEAASQSLVL